MHVIILPHYYYYYSRCTSLFCHIIIIIIQDARHYSATLLLLLFKMHVIILPHYYYYYSRCTSLFCHIIIIIIQDARHYSATLLLLFKMHVNILPQQPWCTSLFCHSSHDARHYSATAAQWPNHRSIYPPNACHCLWIHPLMPAHRGLPGSSTARPNALCRRLSSSTFAFFNYYFLLLLEHGPRLVSLIQPHGTCR